VSPGSVNPDDKQFPGRVAATRSTFLHHSLRRVGSGFRHRPGEHTGMSEISRRAPVVVSAFLDATKPDIKPFVLDRVQTLEATQRELGDGFSATADVYGAPGSKVTHFAKEALAAAKRTGKRGIAALLATAVAGAALSPALIPLGLAGLGCWALSKVPGLGLLWGQRNLPEWTGRRTYEIRADEQRHQVDSKLTSSDEAQRRLSSERVKELVLANQTRFPSAQHVVMVFGHGLGHGALASRPFPEFAKGLKEATQESGQPVSCLVLESCLQGNLESLSALGDSVQLAVASEDDLLLRTSDGSMPLQKMLSSLARGEDATGLLAQLDATDKKARPTQLSFVDVPALQKQLVPSLDALGRCLVAEFEKGHGDFIHIATILAEPLHSHGGQTVLADFGQFLDQLQETACFADDTLAAVKKTREALAAAVPVQHKERTHANLSGLSFSPYLGTGKNLAGEPVPFNNPDLPAGWNAFVRRHTVFLHKGH
jgi:hypothetical protein